MIQEEALGLNFDGLSVTSDSHATAQNQPGKEVTRYVQGGYRTYIYLKAEEAFAAGQVAMISALIDNADVDAVAAIGSTILQANSDFTADEFNDGTFPSAFASIDVNTGFGQTRKINGNRGSSSYLTLESNGWDVALDATSDYVTYDINYVSLADTDDVSARASQVRGVAISAISDEQWGWFQKKGFCPLVRCVGSTDPTIRGALITPSSTAGACKGPTAGGTTADDVANAFGYAHFAYSQADTVGQGVAATLDCR